MKALALVAAISVAALATAGCQTTAQQIGQKEDTLVASGFTMLQANTPARQAQLMQLPANQFVPKTNGDTTTYVYADPAVCHCLYIGNQAAYGAYKKTVLTKQLLDEQQMTALTYQNNWDWGRWDWGPWGGGWWRR